MAPQPMRSRLPPLYALQAFVAAARLGSFTSAASQMHLTQGAVSRQVQQLEEFFGCPLFVRVARGLTLTSEGRELLPAVEDALAQLHVASDRIRQAMTVLTIAIPPTFGARWFTPRLPRLRFALPRLDVRVATHWSEAPDFSRLDVDAVVAHGTGGWPHLVEVPIMREVHTPVCAPGVAQSLREPADLAQVTLLFADARRGAWSNWLARAGLPREWTGPHQIVGTLDMCLLAAARGQGVALADPAILDEAMVSGQLVQPFSLCVESGGRYFLTYPPQRQHERKIVLFQQWLLDEVSAGRFSASSESRADLQSPVRRA